MKPTVFQIGKKTILPQKIQHLLHGLYLALAFIFEINKDVIKVNNNKNIKLLSQNPIDIVLEAGQSVK